jgi:hypothetical protein
MGDGRTINERERAMMEWHSDSNSLSRSMNLGIHCAELQTCPPKFRRTSHWKKLRSS